MLFDLRSTGRRRTVQVIYLGLAILIGGGLILFGVGTGTGGGGLLNGISGNGNGGAQSQAVRQETAAARKAVKLHPTSPQAWASLVQADWTVSQQSGSLNASTGTYTATGKRYLTSATQAWQRYLQLTNNPSTDVAILAARAYGQLSQYASEASAWEYVVQANPSEAKGYECLAFSAYAAKQTRKAELAAAKAQKLIPKLQQLTFKQELATAKTNPAVAQQC